MLKNMAMLWNSIWPTSMQNFNIILFLAEHNINVTFWNATLVFLYAIHTAFDPFQILRESWTQDKLDAFEDFWAKKMGISIWHWLYSRSNVKITTIKLCVLNDPCMRHVTQKIACVHMVMSPWPVLSMQHLPIWHLHHLFKGTSAESWFTPSLVQLQLQMWLKWDFNIWPHLVAIFGHLHIF